MKLVPYLAVLALAASVECMSLFSPYDDFSSELPSDDSEYILDSSDEDVPSAPSFFNRDALGRRATHRRPRVGVRRVIMVSFEPSPADQFGSDEDVGKYSPLAELRPWTVPRKLIKTYPSEDSMFPNVPKVVEERFDWPESNEDLSASQWEKSVSPEFWKSDSSLFNDTPAAAAPLPKVPRRAPASKRLDWPVEVEDPRKPSIMRPVSHMSTPSPFERSLADLEKAFKKAEEQEALDRELDALKYKYHPNVVQI